jgi:TRAP transporter TAXI family solute receptor
MEKRNGFQKLAGIIAIMSIVLFLQPGIGVPAEKVTITGAGGSMGGNWYALMAGLAEIVHGQYPEITLRVVPGGGASNPIRISSGELDIATVATHEAIQALKGEFAWKNQPCVNITALVNGLNPNFMYFMVDPETGVTSIDEIFEKKIPLRIATGEPGSGTEAFFRTILKYYNEDYETVKKWGMKVFNVGHGQSGELYKDRHVDASFQGIGAPAASIEDMLLGRKIRFLPIIGKLEEFLEKTTRMPKTVLPAGVYKGQDKEIPTMGLETLLIARKDLKEELAYKVTRAINDNEKKVQSIASWSQLFEAKKAYVGIGIPLHLGAEKYYREKGFLK